jgi:hypothetical protein
MENEAQTNAQDRTFTIVSDSKSALQSIENPSKKPSQHIVHSISNLAKKLKEDQVKLQLHWIPRRGRERGKERESPKTASGTLDQIWLLETARDVELRLRARVRFVDSSQLGAHLHLLLYYSTFTVERTIIMKLGDIRDGLIKYRSS